jgi:pyrroline-5-carboxylate reductase
MKRKVGVIGCGNMGSALVKGAVTHAFCQPDEVIVWDPQAQRRNRLKKTLHVETAKNNGELALQSATILLAVKPQDMVAVLEEIRPYLDHRPLIVSVAAGISTKFLESHLPLRLPIVRVMPNTPALIGQGMSAMAAGRWATHRHIAYVKRLFRCVGDVLKVPECWLDAVTAVSGSGPAYFFFLMEQMMEAGIRLGLPPPVARRLVLTTAQGASALAQVDPDPVALRARVTSKGGTTEAAFRVFKRFGLAKILQSGIQAAARRAKELNR